MDLVGRKILKDGGQRLGRFLVRLRGGLPSGPTGDAVAAMVDRFAGAVAGLGKRAQRNPDTAGLAATPLLRALGDILCAQLLVRRAAVAERQLAGDPPPERARFLRAKVEVARFYVEQLLPDAAANLARVTSDDMSALADVL
jgi:hypothetical protein